MKSKDKIKEEVLKELDKLGFLENEYEQPTTEKAIDLTFDKTIKKTIDEVEAFLKRRTGETIPALMIEDEDWKEQFKKGKRASKASE